MPLQCIDGMGIYKCYGNTPTLWENTSGVGIRQYLYGGCLGIHQCFKQINL